MTRERGQTPAGGSRRAAAAALFICALLSAPASAQVTPANGIKVGDGRLHPFLEIDGRFDSLVGFFPTTAGSTTYVPTGDLILHARPGLKFELMNSSTTVSVNASGEYLFHTGVFSVATRSLSRIQANLVADARFNQDGAVEFQIADTLSRSDRTQNPALGIGALSLFNVLSIAAPIHPGGKALTITPRVAWGIEFFSPQGGALPGCVPGTTCDGSAANLATMNYSNVNLNLNGSWKFLPKTAVTLDVGADIRTYFTGTTAPATVFRAQAGLLGLFTEHLSVTALAGYSGEFATTTPLHTVIGTAEVTWAPSQMIKVSAGYLRTLQPVPTLRSYMDDRAYARGTLGLWAGRLTLGAQVAFDYLSFVQVTPQRFDMVLVAGATATVNITSWFDVGVGYNLSVRSSNDKSSAAINPPARHEATLRLALHY